MAACGRLLCAAMLLACAGRAWAVADEYRLDPVHTRVMFRIDHAGLSRAIGTFSGATGQLRFDPDDWSTATLDVSVPLASLDLGDEGWRDKVLARSFLDAAGQPSARFVSTRVEAAGEGQARVHGLLSLRGTSREVTLEVRLNAVKRHPVTLRRSAGFSATARVSRRDFGIDAWPNVIGDDVEIWIEAEAQHGQGTPAARQPEQDDADQEPR